MAHPPPEEGQRIRLLSMPHDPCPVEPGTEGTIKTVTGNSFGQIYVEWDDGRGLILLDGTDDWELVNDHSSDSPAGQ